MNYVELTDQAIEVTNVHERGLNNTLTGLNQETARLNSSPDVTFDELADVYEQFGTSLDNMIDDPFLSDQNTFISTEKHAGINAAQSRKNLSMRKAF